jgi:putative flippase GtrA
LRLRARTARVTLDAMTRVGDLWRRVPATVVRFATVGVANTALDVALFWALNASLGMVAANFISTSAGMTFSFLANGRRTFRASRVTRHQAAMFLSTNAVTMWLLQPLLIATGTHVFGVPLVAAKVLGLGGSVVSNFLLYRYVVWPREADATVDGPAVTVSVSTPR